MTINKLAAQKENQYNTLWNWRRTQVHTGKHCLQMDAPLCKNMMSGCLGPKILCFRSKRLIQLPLWDHFVWTWTCPLQDLSEFQACLLIIWLSINHWRVRYYLILSSIHSLGGICKCQFFRLVQSLDKYFPWCGKRGFSGSLFCGSKRTGHTSQGRSAYEQ